MSFGSSVKTYLSASAEVAQALAKTNLRAWADGNAGPDALAHLFRGIAPRGDVSLCGSFRPTPEESVGMRLTEVPTCEGCIETVELEIGQRHPAPSDPPTDADLRYAADARCVCGAGLAYFKASRLDRNEPGYDSWVCSAAIKKQLPPINEDPHVGKHKLLPFSFYEVKSEDQPSAGGRSTRPKGGNA